MCLIIDASMAVLLLTRQGPALEWLTGVGGNPKLVIGGKLTVELEWLAGVRRLLVQLERAGRLRRIDVSLIEKEVRTLEQRQVCESNDAHVLALAIISGARTLATDDDDLIRDFKNT